MDKAYEVHQGHEGSTHSHQRSFLLVLAFVLN